jgi:hypothetical protein
LATDLLFRLGCLTGLSAVERLLAVGETGGEGSNREQSPEAERADLPKREKI